MKTYSIYHRIVVKSLTVTLVELKKYINKYIKKKNNNTKKKINKNIKIIKIN
jgi:hypothetical protein